MARPTKYDTHVKPYFKEIKEAVDRGVDEKEIAKSLSISKSTWIEYKHKFSDFSNLLKRDEDKTKEILKQLDNALLKSATGFVYEEEKEYATIDKDGNVKKHKEKYKKYSPPNPTSIFGAFNRFDPDYKKDKAYYDLKRQELELKKALAEVNNFDLNFDELEV